MIIDFSGTDGTGKTTAYNYFCDQLEARGKRVLRTREVGSPLIPGCVELRKTILYPKYKMDGRATDLVLAAPFGEKDGGHVSLTVEDRVYIAYLR